MTTVPTARRRVRAPYEIDDFGIAVLIQETLLCYETIRRWRDGRRVASKTKLRLERACAKHGIELRAKTQRRRAA